MSNLFCTPRKIISGQDALENSRAELSAMGKKAFIVSDGMMQKLGNIQRLIDILDMLGTEYCVFANVDHEPTDIDVLEGVNKYRKEGCDFLVALGGGSPIDAMKGIAMISALGGLPSDYFGKKVTGKLPPMAAIPTTAGTGSEVSNVTIISDTKSEVKMLLIGDSLLPDLAIVDPVFTFSVPEKTTAYTGLDSLCHCVEAYTSRKAQPLSDLFALSAAKLIFGNLQKAFDEPHDPIARENLALAATEAGIAFTNSSVTVIHGMSRPIGAVFHLPHGLANALLMEVCLEFARKGAESRFADIARYCIMVPAGATDSEAADAFFDNLARLRKGLNIQNIATYGVDREEFVRQIPKLAGDALKSGSPANTLIDVSARDIESLYMKLWQ